MQGTGILRHRLLSMLLIFFIGQTMMALPVKKNVRIELVYDGAKTSTTVMGSTKMSSTLPYSYFYLMDIYSKDERKIGSDSYGENVSVFEFELDHPLYDEIRRGINVRIPFYVEPGDTLVIHLDNTGRAKRYERKSGESVWFENLLLHDFSNKILYDEKEFMEDRKDVFFPEFIERVLQKMRHSVDSVRGNADRYGFSDTERSIAVNNVKLQYALWIFEYAPFKASELSTYSSKHKEGWQSIPQQDNAIASIENVTNYIFMRELPLSDSTCMASKFFPRFLMSYEHTHVLNCDQYLYYGTTPEDEARMDSALIAKEKKLTGLTSPSLFMELAIESRHYVPLPDDGSIKLKEVKVIGHQNTQYNIGISEADMMKARLNNRPTYNALSPSYWLFDRKREKRFKRAQELIKKWDEEEERERAEREAVMKAYEEEMNRGK